MTTHIDHVTQLAAMAGRHQGAADALRHTAVHLRQTAAECSAQLGKGEEHAAIAGALTSVLVRTAEQLERAAEDEQGRATGLAAKVGRATSSPGVQAGRRVSAALRALTGR